MSYGYHFILPGNSVHSGAILLLKPEPPDRGAGVPPVRYNVVSVYPFLFTCAKDDSARYEEAGCEESNERAQMVGKVHELLQPAEQPVTSGRHLT